MEEQNLSITECLLGNETLLANVIEATSNISSTSASCGIVKEDKTKCSICERKFSDSTSLERHLKFHKEGKRICYCGVCGKDFGNKTGLNYHLTVHTGERAYSCELCGKRYTQRPSLNAHMKVHQEIHPHACDKCDRKFQRGSLLEKHLKNKSSCPSRRRCYRDPLSCSICARYFPTALSVAQHEKTHEPFSCIVCHKSFKQKQSLTEHVQTHATNMCDGCGKVFPTKSALRIHKTMHNDSKHKPFACVDCDARFASKERIRDHLQRGHPEKSTEDNCACDICGQFFSKRYGLKRHMKTHNKVINCIVCEKKFSHQHLLIKHLRSHQPKTPESLVDNIIDSPNPNATATNRSVNDNAASIKKQFLQNTSSTAGLSKFQSRFLLPVYYVVNPIQQDNNTSFVTSERQMDSKNSIQDSSAPNMSFPIRIIAEGDPGILVKQEPLENTVK